MQLLQLLPQTFKNSLKELKTHLKPHTNRAYLVGGCVRDLVLKREVIDLDIEVYDISKKDFESLMKKIGAIGVGKSFFVYKWNDVDIALPRIEKKIASGHRGFEVKLAHNEKEASKRRDFSMNALMLNLFDGNLLDFWGGLDDIKNKQIKIIDEIKFKEDSLRILRAMQFSSRLGFKIDDNSIKIMQNIDLKDLSKERIFWEFEKMFNSTNLHFGLYYLFKLNIAKKLLDLRLPYSTFIKTALEFQRNLTKFDTDMYRYYFLYILAKNLKIEYDYIPTKISTKSDYIKILQNQIDIPPIVNKCFLAKIALKYPIKKWLGNYSSNTKELAKELNIYDKLYDGGINPQDVINDGFRGKKIGKELLKRKLQKIKKDFCAKIAT